MILEMLYKGVYKPDSELLYINKYDHNIYSFRFIK
jgi:hypothetical protein